MLWDTATGAARQTLEGHSNWVKFVVFSPDGKVVASASHDKTIRLWDAATGAPLQTIEGHSNWVKFVVFSPDGKVVASASHDKTIRLWDAATGAPLQTVSVLSPSRWTASWARLPRTKRQSGSGMLPRERRARLLSLTYQNYPSQAQDNA